MLGQMQPKSTVYNTMAYRRYITYEGVQLSTFPAIIYSKAVFEAVTKGNQTTFHCLDCDLEVEDFCELHPLEFHQNNNLNNCSFLREYAAREEKVDLPDEFDQTNARMESLLSLSKEINDREIQNRWSLVVSKDHQKAIFTVSEKTKAELMTENAEWYRRTSLACLPQKATPSQITECAATGFFYYEGNDGALVCVFCDCVVPKWIPEVAPAWLHRVTSPNCPFLKGMNADKKNIPDVLKEMRDDSISSIEQQRWEIADCQRKAHPEFEDGAKREEGLLLSAGNEHQLKLKLETGFFVNGSKQGNLVLSCFQCGIEVMDESVVDHIWAEHARKNRECPFLLEKKGAEFVSSAIVQYGEYGENEGRQVVHTITTTSLDYMMTGDSAQKFLQMGYEENELRAAISHNLQIGGSSVADLVRAILADRDRERTAANRETADMAASAVTRRRENESTRERQRLQERGNTEPAMEVERKVETLITCQVCQKRDAGSFFLPCFHRVYCVEDAPIMLQCSECRQDVKGIVRACLPSGFTNKR